MYATDARSVYDYLEQDATSTSSDKRMAGALFREMVRQPGAHVRWVDGVQNMANVLTKSHAEKETLKTFLREGMIGLTQSEANAPLKLKQRAEMAKRWNQSHKKLQKETQLKDTIWEIEKHGDDDKNHQQS